jgi:Zn-dependent protease
VRSLPSGLISALIIGIGMAQAWRMTAADVALAPMRPDHDVPAAEPDALEAPAAPEMSASPHTPEVQPASQVPWYKRGITAVVALIVLLVGKLKFLVLGLTKASTLLSMFAFFGVYWTTYGWPLALGLVVSIYIHEMGHVAMLRRFGIHAGAPLFIPGIGALVLLKQRITDPQVDAKVGLAGPVWGLGAGLAAYIVYRVTGIGTWGAIAGLTGFINLFNLIPVWQLDGSRGFHALASWQRWVVVVAMGAAGIATGQRLLLLLGLVAVWRAFQRTSSKPDNSALATYVVLVFALAWLSVSHSIG